MEQNTQSSGGTPIVTAAEPTSAQNAAAAGQGLPGSPVNFEGETLRGWYQQDVQKGKVSLEQANADLVSRGLKPLEGLKPHPIDTLMPGAKPTDYRLPDMYQTLGEDRIFVHPDIRKFDETARNWLSSAGFSKEIGSGLMTMIDQVGKEIYGTNEATQKSYALKEEQKLQKAWGADYAENLKLARQLVHEMETKSPGLVELLETSGAGNSALVIQQFLFQAKHLYERNVRGK